MSFDLFGRHMSVGQRIIFTRRWLCIRISFCIFLSFRRIAGLFVVRCIHGVCFSSTFHKWIKVECRFDTKQCEYTTHFLVFPTRTSSSDDSVSSLSDEECSGFSYCNKRSNRNERSLVTFSKRRWLERRASWKNSFSFHHQQTRSEECQRWKTTKIENSFATNSTYV